MSQVPGALILSFEPGLNAIAGAYSQKINTWSEFLQVLKQLEKPEVKEKFKTIALDTVTIAAELCQEYVCATNGVKSLADVPYGRLYKVYETEFSKAIRKIVMLGYGAIFSCHTETKTIKVGDVEYEKLQPKLERRAFDAVNSLVDVIGIGISMYDENGDVRKVLCTADTPTVAGGNRFRYFPKVIDFSYQSVLDNLIAAIEKEGQNGATLIEKDEEDNKLLTFNEVREQAATLWESLVAKDNKNAEKILSIVEEVFGEPLRLSEITEVQVDPFRVVLERMKEL